MRYFLIYRDFSSNYLSVCLPKAIVWSAYIFLPHIISPSTFIDSTVPTLFLVFTSYLSLHAPKNMKHLVQEQGTFVAGIAESLGASFAENCTQKHFHHDAVKLLAAAVFFCCLFSVFTDNKQL